MNKFAFIDIGELGWSLYLSAHIRWIKKHTAAKVIVVSYADRKCLYEGIANHFMAVPDKFSKKYNILYQDSFKLRYVSWDELRLFFLPRIPSGFRIPEYNEYPTRFEVDTRIYAPYKYSKPPEPGKEILVFPRFRVFSRNLPEDFYKRLIKRLCDEFPKVAVRTVGTKDGAYNMRVKRPNYINWVGKGETIQDLIDRCQSAVATVGSQSGPLKLSLLQGVPAFMIGHQKDRHTQDENWMHTKVGFYEIDKKEYTDFKFDDCIRKAVAFVKEIK